MQVCALVLMPCLDQPAVWPVAPVTDDKQRVDDRTADMDSKSRLLSRRATDAATPVARVPAVLVRGGTSKCWIFFREALHASGYQTDALLLRGFGSPDPRQIDGVGGGTPTTSKAIVIEPGLARSTQAEVRYSFAQVGVDAATVDWTSNCGNCATALGLFALASGLVPASSPTTQVRLHNIVTGLDLDVEVPTPDGVAEETGEARLTGVTHAGVPVDVRFSGPSWSTTGRILPTGRPVDRLIIDGRPVRATLIDAGAPAALLLAEDVGLTGADQATDLLARRSWFDDARRAAAVAMGLPDDSRAVPKVGVVAGPPDAEGRLSVRMMSMTAPHPMIGLTSAVAIAVATGQPGTLVHRGTSAALARKLTLAVLGGEVELEVDPSGTGCVRFHRTARLLADAVLSIPREAA